jgi:tetratricopeptide (TPR) repeat protein
MAMGLTLKPNIFTKILKRLLLAASMCCLVATANAAPMDDAYAAYQRGDYVQALKIFRSLASQGDATAQNNIGSMYYNGYGVTQDYQEALKLFRLAAAQGDATAIENLKLPGMVAAQLQQNKQSNQPQQTQGKVLTQPPKRNLPILLGR